MDPKLAHVTDPAYLTGLGGLPIERIRSMRTECQDLENALSYVRRIAQGRLDIVGAEIERRRDGGPSDLGDLIGRLPDILADRGHGSGLGRPPQEMSAEDGAVTYTAEVDQILGPARVGSVAELNDAALEDVRSRLEAYERLTSDRRRMMHSIIDTLQTEITRRYRSGEASVDSLLQ